MININGTIYEDDTARISVLDRGFLYGDSVYDVVKGYKDNLIMIGPDVWRGSEVHPEFTEDESLFKLWHEKANKDGLRVRIGRWNISGNPIVILIDFTNFFSEKDKILANLWESYKLDPISGAWDYLEPALFGYSAGKVIESFSKYHFKITCSLRRVFYECFRIQ